MKLIPALLFATSLWAQCSGTTPISSHPRMILNDCVADTWDPAHYPGGGAKGRLSAIVARTGAGGAANADFSNWLGQLSGNPVFGTGAEANINYAMAWAMAYAIYHKAGNDNAANPYAAALWSQMVGIGGVTYPITQIACGNTGAGCTVTLAAAANPPIATTTPMVLRGITSNDSLCGIGLTITSVPDATHFVFTPTVFSSAYANQTYTDPTIIGVTAINYLNPATANYNNFTSQIDQNANLGSYASAWAYFYDWCYDWLNAKGYLVYAKSQLLAAYWSNTIKLNSTGFNQNVRESVFHNYTAKEICATLEIGTALYGEDPAGALALADGMGYFWQGINVAPNGDHPTTTYIYNLSVDTDVLTGGGMNWEGPRYWRVGAANHVRAIEAYDTATSRKNNIWSTYFPNTKNAGWYRVYSTMPDTTMANLGDVGQGYPYVGRDNFGMVIINDRFPDPHFVYFMGTLHTDWNNGAYGQVGLCLKLIFWPYVNGPGNSGKLSDLPRAMKIGPDVFVSSGWGTADSYYNYSSSLRGTYHRHEDAGSFQLYSNGAMLIPGQPYTLRDPVYTDYNRRTIGANTLTVYDPHDCWIDSLVPGCGTWYFPMVNDGGQLKSDREWYPQFPGTTAGGPYSINRLWSATTYKDPRYSTLYSATHPIAQPVLSVGTGYEHITNDLSPLYSNAYSGTGYNPTLKTPNAPGSITRDIVHFQATLGSLNPWIVFDRVLSTNASFLKGWNIHTVNAPSVNGSAVMAGDTTINGATVTSVDNGTSRMFINHLLPANPNVRAVGGNACPLIPIQGASNANPAVFYAPAHGLKAGELIGIATGLQPDGGGKPTYWPAWLLDNGFSPGEDGRLWAVASTPDPDHFTVGPTYGSATPTVTATVTYGNPTTFGNVTWPNMNYVRTGTVLTIAGASCSALNGNQTITTGNGTFTIPVDSSSCSGAFDGTIFVPWTTVFVSGNGTPSGTAKFDGQVYYQQDAAAGNHVWQYYSGVWQHLTGANYASSANYASPVVYSHSSCNFAYYVDQYGPAGSAGAHLWDGSMDVQAPGYRPNWRVVEQPSASQTQDYFLNVVHSVTTSVSAAPPTTLISGTGAYGAMVADSGGVYVAVFASSSSPVSTLSYTATHSGSGTHVVAGLTPAGSYAVTQGGTSIYTGAADASGALAFNEKGGGTFQVAQHLAIMTPGSLPACSINVPCPAVLAASGGAGSYVWSIVAGALPPGLALSPGGSITGTPAAVGLYSFTVMVADAGNGTVTQPVSIQVQSTPSVARPGGAVISGRVAH